jgi:hypothetical protein
MPCIIKDFRTSSEIKEDNEKIKQKNLNKHQFIIKLLKEVNSTWDEGKEDEYYTGYAYFKNSKLLCSICQNLNISKYSKDLQEWWELHKIEDRENLQKKLSTISLNIHKQLQEEYNIKFEKEKNKFLNSLNKYELSLLEFDDFTI